MELGQKFPGGFLHDPLVPDSQHRPVRLPWPDGSNSKSKGSFRHSRQCVRAFWHFSVKNALQVVEVVLSNQNAELHVPAGNHHSTNSYHHLLQDFPGRSLSNNILTRHPQWRDVLVLLEANNFSGLSIAQRKLGSAYE